MEPVSRLNVLPGSEVMFTVAADGDGLSYQWQIDDFDIDDSRILYWHEYGFSHCCIGTRT